MHGLKFSEVSIKINSDPYNTCGARVAVHMSRLPDIPTDPLLMRLGSSLVENPNTQSSNVTEGGVASEWYSTTTYVKGVAPRLSYGNTWYTASGTAVIRLEDNPTVLPYLFVFVTLEDYTITRNGFFEGASCAEPIFELETTDDYDRGTRVYDCRGVSESDVFFNKKLAGGCTLVLGNQYIGCDHVSFARVFSAGVYDETQDIYEERTFYGAVIKSPGSTVEHNCVLEGDFGSYTSWFHDALRDLLANYVGSNIDTSVVSWVVAFNIKKGPRKHNMVYLDVLLANGDMFINLVCDLERGRIISPPADPPYADIESRAIHTKLGYSYSVSIRDAVWATGYNTTPGDITPLVAVLSTGDLFIPNCASSSGSEKGFIPPLLHVEGGTVDSVSYALTLGRFLVTGTFTSIDGVEVQGKALIDVTPGDSGTGPTWSVSPCLPGVEIDDCTGLKVAWDPENDVYYLHGRYQTVGGRKVCGSILVRYLDDRTDIFPVHGYDGRSNDRPDRHLDIGSFHIHYTNSAYNNGLYYTIGGVLCNDSIDNNNQL